MGRLIFSMIQKMKIIHIVALSLIMQAMIFFTGESACSAQSIPMGTWRLHISYNSIHALTAGNGKIYGAAQNGVMILDVAEKTIETYNKVNGLSGADISAIDYDTQTSQLVIAYADGKVDIIKDNVISGFDQLKNATGITGSRKVNHISIRDGFAYLAADYGVSVIDLQRGEVKETWRDLGPAGNALPIIQSAFLGDSIFLATEKGVMAGNLNDNLLDFSMWRRLQDSETDTVVNSIASFQNKIYAAISHRGIYRYENGAWSRENFLQSVPLQNILSSGDRLFIAQGTKLWALNASLELNELVSDRITWAQALAHDNNGNLWIGDLNNGIVTNAGGAFVNYVPDGPAFSIAFRLKFIDNTLYVLQGGPSSVFQPLQNPGIVSMFSSSWTSTTTALPDVTDVAMFNGKVFMSSFGGGVQAGNINAPETIYNSSNSTLTGMGSGDDSVNVIAMANSPDGLWVVNYGVNSSLHLLANDGWVPFSFGLTAGNYLTDLVVDRYGSVWAPVDQQKGGGVFVFNRDENMTVYLTDASGTGGLPDRAVRSVAVDRDGYVWVGTDKGVSYFSDPADVFDGNVDGIEPIFESRYLLREDKVTALAVDGGNRKWMGTERGVWLLGPAGEELVYNFTEDNSPLLSNVIRDIEINHATGEVFFATDKGIASFRSDATSSEPFFQQVRIFPNPVTADFAGTIGITGLATDAIVKITDASGKLIWQTRANGGTATWNGVDHNGRRAAAGIYLVFSATEDGMETFAGKIAIVK